MSSVTSFRKNGLVIFGSRLVSIITGLLFLIMVTGWLRPARFGLWEVIIDIVTFASYPAGLLTFWATRDIARGKPVGRTVILLNLVLSLLGLVIYALFSIPAFGRFNTSYGPFLLAALLVPLAYWSSAATSTATGYRPALMGYALLISEAAKLIVAYPALYIYHLEINGVLLAIIVSYLVQSLVITVVVSPVIVPKSDLATARRWISDSWIPALFLVPSQLANADTFVASVVAGSTIITGYYQAAFALGSIVSYAGLLTTALYPLLVRGGTARAPSMTLDLILMFALPMAVGEIVLAPHFLALLSPFYVSGSSNVSFALIILAVWGVMYALSLFADNALLGMETSDVGAERSFRSYLKSSFLFVSEVNVGYLSVYLLGVSIVVFIGTAAHLPFGEVVTAWALIQLGILTPAVILKIRRVKSKAQLGFPHSLPAYIACSLVMAAVLLGVSAIAPPLGSGRLFLGEWITGLVAAGAVTYFGVLVAVDRGARNLFLLFVGTLSSRRRAVPGDAPAGPGAPESADR